MAEIFAYLYGFHLADFHIFVFNFGFAGFQPFCGLEGDGYGGAFFGDGF